MMYQVSFGSQRYELNDPRSRVAQPLIPLASTLPDPAAAVRDALAAPTGLPPLSEITVEGDRVVLALGDASALMPTVCAAVVEALMEGPVVAEHISVLTPVDTPLLVEQVEQAIEALLLPGQRGQCQVLPHAPAEQEQLAYLAASKEGRPIYLNRRICDADMVISLGVTRAESSFNYHGVHGNLYPAFADAEGRQRFAAPSNFDWPTHRRRRREEASEAAHLAGILFTVQVVPGQEGGAIAILAGLDERVAEQAQQRANGAWSMEPPVPAELVVAALGGGAAEQSWDNFARALSTARAMVAPEGAIVICSEIADLPGPALRCLRTLDGLDALQRHLHRSREDDAATASLLAQTLEYLNVFLVSSLPDASVEELGMAPLHSGDELQRLIDRCESTLLLPNAQYVALQPVEPASIASA